MVRKVLVLALLALLLGCIALPALLGAVPPATLPMTGFGVMVSAAQHTYTRPMIKMSLTVFNYTTTPVILNFKTSQRYDFTIFNNKGVKVWQWSDGQQFQPILGELTLKPNDTVTYTAEYQAQQMPEDLYTLKGELTAFDMRLRKQRVIEGTVSFWRVLVR